MATSKRFQKILSLDRMSDLPKPILTSILSLLPIEQAVRTSILSKKWRYLWNSIPNLELTDTMDLPHEDNYVYEIDLNRWLSVVYHILLSHQHPIEKCRFSINFVEPYTLDFHNFILCLSKKGIQELILFNTGINFYKITPYAFLCNSLKKLELWNCEVNLPFSFKRFGTLKTLELCSVAITNGQLERLISCCPVLERLRLDACVWGSNLCISAPNLKTLEIDTRSPIGISLKDVSSLDHASFWFAWSCTKIIYKRYQVVDGEEVVDQVEEGRTDEVSQIVKLLMSLHHVQSLSLYFVESFAECLLGEKLPERLPAQYQLVNLKKLTMLVNLTDVSATSILSCLLRSCPCLEDLVIEISMFDPPSHFVELDYWEKQRPSECLIYHLKKVQIDGVYPDCDYVMGFVKYLLMSAHVLKRMSISHYPHLGEKAKDRLFEFLLLRKASPCAVVTIKPS
ncbi:F-box/FBD/LRR-repeat protein At1g13570-like [Tasmannia lanceolata]|uniref:F-box/FBD/LRR-repeat protein At1g13570-like n=1 Tax=Tasmannia lanceolata TaxID=3420 RepID=UPI004062BDEB